MKVEISRVNEALLLEAKDENGNAVMIEGSAGIGGSGKGVLPTDLLLMAIGSCSSMDVLSILKKQRQSPEDYTVSVSGEKEKIGSFSPFTKIHLHFRAKNVEKGKLENAIRLSLKKYCSVSYMLEKTAAISWSCEV